LVFASGLNEKLDSGELTTDEFYEQFCRELGCRPELDALAYAASDIFELNYSMSAVLGRLVAARKRLGLLSKPATCTGNTSARAGTGSCPRRSKRIVLELSRKNDEARPEDLLYAAELAACGRKNLLRRRHAAACGRGPGRRLRRRCNTPQRKPSSPSLPKRGVRLSVLRPRRAAIASLPVGTIQFIARRVLCEHRCLRLKRSSTAGAHRAPYKD